MTEITKEKWQKFSDSHHEANFLQSVQWGELHEKLGYVVIRRGVEKDGKLIAGWQGIVKDARRGRYLEVPGAPLLDWSNTELIREITEQFRETAKQQKCVFVRIRPQLIDTDEHQKILTNAGFKKAPFHLHAEHTNILDLTETEDEIMAKMRRQTRYEVRRSVKQNIVVSSSSEVRAIEEFCEVQAETAQRQGFVPSSQKFLKTLVEAFGENARVYRAEKDGQLLNLALVLWHGEEVDYFEAASTLESRKFAGAYGLQWQSIRDAKSAGKTRYNFWGIAYSDDPHHRYAGVTTFKRGFGGDDTIYVPAHDLVISRVKYIKNWLIETARRKKRRL